MAVGSEQSGKSAAVRADDGLAALIVHEVFGVFGFGLGLVRDGLTLTLTTVNPNP